MRIVLMLLYSMGLATQVAVAAPTLDYRVVRTTTHERSAFTQGLVVADGQLIEGTGLYGQSRLTVRELGSGRLLHEVVLPRDEFGEGVAVVGDRIIQLTWQNAVAHVYDRMLRPVGSFRINTEGWGLTYDGHRLVLSDGSSRLRFLDPQSHVETGHVDVMDEGLRVEHLNELEFIDGMIYANVWQSDRIAVIDPQSGIVRAWLDLTSLHERLPRDAGWNNQDFVLNGIAVLPSSGNLLITGKCWPLMFEIALTPSAVIGRQRKPHR